MMWSLALPSLVTLLGDYTLGDLAAGVSLEGISITQALVTSL